ncbi:Paf1 complex component, partial [Linderina macrospora]
MDDLFGSDVSDNETKSNPRSPVAPDTPTKAVDDLFGSDVEEPVAPRHEKTDGDALEDLFGSDEDGEDGGQTGDRHTEHAGAAEDDDDDAQSTHSIDEDKYTRQNVKVLAAKIPVLAMPRASDSRFVIARTPNILQFEATPFSADAYEDVIADEHREVERSGYRKKVTAEMASAVDGVISNTVRWRVGKDGRRESNTRLVRWSDGSTTVMVGGNVPESYSVSVDSLAAEHQYVAAQYPSAYLMVSHAKLTDKWSLRPARQSVRARHAVSHLLTRVKTAGSAAHKSGGTRFM